MFCSFPLDCPSDLPEGKIYSKCGNFETFSSTTLEKGCESMLVLDRGLLMLTTEKKNLFEAQTRYLSRTY